MLVLIYPGNLFVWVSLVGAGVTLLVALIAAPWRAFFSVRDRGLLWLGYWLVLTFIWLLRIPVAEVLSMHLTGLTAAVFIFGWPLTVILGAFAVLANQLMHPLAWYNVTGHFFLSVAIPATAAWIARTFIHKLPIDNLFVFILGGGFFGAMLTTALTAVTALFCFWVLDAWSVRIILQDHLWIYAVSMFPEGFMGGSVLTTVTVLWPWLVKGYDEDRYLSD